VNILINIGCKNKVLKVGPYAML